MKLGVIRFPLWKSNNDLDKSQNSLNVVTCKMKSRPTVGKCDFLAFSSWSYTCPVVAELVNDFLAVSSWSYTCPVASEKIVWKRACLVVQNVL